MRSDDWPRARFQEVYGQVRARTGLTDKQIADIAGISRSTANRWNRGEGQPDYVNIRTFADYLREHHPRLDDLATELIYAAGYGGDPVTTSPSRDRGPGFFSGSDYPDDLRDDVEYAIWDVHEAPEDERWQMIVLHRVILERNQQTA